MRELDETGTNTLSSNSESTIELDSSDISYQSQSLTRRMQSSESSSFSHSLFSQGRLPSFMNTTAPLTRSVSFARIPQPSRLPSRLMNIGIDKENDFIVKERSYRLAKAINNRIHPHNFFATHSKWYRVTTSTPTHSASPLDDGFFLYYNPQTGEVSTILPDGYPFSDEDLLYANVLDVDNHHLEDACTAHVLSMRLYTAVQVSLFNRHLHECVGMLSSTGCKIDAFGGLSSTSRHTLKGHHCSSIDTRLDASSLTRDMRTDSVSMREFRPKETSISSRESRLKETSSVSSRESHSKETISSRESHSKETISSRESRSKERGSSHEGRDKHASSTDSPSWHHSMPLGIHSTFSQAPFSSPVVPTANQQGDGFAAAFPHLKELRSLLFESAGRTCG